jgi:predicted transcriptional regulator
MSDNAVNAKAQALDAKAQEIIEAIAEQTSVNRQDVEKILNRLGLSGALEHRQYMEEVSAKYGCAMERRVRTLDNVSFVNIRIAAGEKCE